MLCCGTVHSRCRECASMYVCVCVRESACVKWLPGLPWAPVAPEEPALPAGSQSLPTEKKPVWASVSPQLCCRHLEVIVLWGRIALLATLSGVFPLHASMCKFPIRQRSFATFIISLCSRPHCLERSKCTWIATEVPLLKRWDSGFIISAAEWLSRGLRVRRTQSCSRRVAPPSILLRALFGRQFGLRLDC